MLCTARQQDRDVFELLTDLLRSRQPKLLDILPAETVAIAQLRPAQSAVAIETFPAFDHIPLLPGSLPASPNPSICNSA